MHQNKLSSISQFWENPDFLQIKFYNIDYCGQSYKASTIVIYDSRVVPDWKIPHIMTPEL